MFRRKPDWFDAYIGRAASLSAMQRYKEANETFAEAFAKGIDLSAEGQARKQKLTYAYDYWAFALSESRRYQESREKSGLSANEDPKAWTPRFRLAYTLGDMGCYEESIEQYREVKKLEKTLPYPYHNIAYIRQLQGQYREARETFREVCQYYQDGLTEALRQRDGDYCLYYADARYEAFQELEVVEQLLQAGLALDPLNARVQSRLARLYLDKEKVDTSTQPRWQALECYRATERNLDRRLEFFRDAHTLAELGELHLLMGEDEKAGRAFEEAIEKDCNSARAHKGMGEVNLSLGRYVDAIRSFKNSLLWSPDDLSVKSSLAQTYLKADMLDDAENWYLQVQKA